MCATLGRASHSGNHPPRLPRHASLLDEILGRTHRCVDAAATPNMSKFRKSAEVEIMFSSVLGVRTLLGAPGLTARNKKLLGAPGIATRSKGHRYKEIQENHGVMGPADHHFCMAQKCSSNRPGCKSSCDPSKPKKQVQVQAQTEFHCR